MTEVPFVAHAFPFRLIERAQQCGDQKAVLVLGTADGFLRRTEPWPLTLVVEALAQSILLIDPPQRFERLRLAGLYNVAVHQPVTAGDRLEVVVRPLGALGELRRYRCRATRAGALVALADVTVAS
ncbi:MAG: hypothetical protein QM379_04115 [Acidobacteriota bacterium]|nr:hypothetical protein [Acidobacteriota bacterium]